MTEVRQAPEGRLALSHRGHGSDRDDAAVETSDPVE
jgi:hypothetical protein